MCIQRCHNRACCLRCSVIILFDCNIPGEVWLHMPLFFPVALCFLCDIKYATFPVINGAILICIYAGRIKKLYKSLPVLIFLRIVVVNKIYDTCKEHFCWLLKELVISATSFILRSCCFHKNTCNGHNIWLISDITEWIKMDTHRHSFFRLNIHDHYFISVIFKILPCLLIELALRIRDQKITAELTKHRTCKSKWLTWTWRSYHKHIKIWCLNIIDW